MKTKEKLKIIIINNETDEVIISDIPGNRDAEDFIRDDLYIRPKDCNWIVRQELYIKIL